MFEFIKNLSIVLARKKDVLVTGIVAPVSPTIKNTERNYRRA